MLVVVTTSTHGSMPALKRNLAYDAVRDLLTSASLADATLVLLVRRTICRRRTIDRTMRDRPGQLNYSH